jgi:hypothetical protein
MAMDAVAQSARIRCIPQPKLFGLIHSNHNVRRFHDHGHFAAGFNAEFVNAFICDGRRDCLPIADIHNDVAGSGPLGYFGNSTLYLIASTEAHDHLLCDLVLCGRANGDP